MEVCVCVCPEKKQTDTQEAVVCFVRIVRVRVLSGCVSCVRDDRAEAPGEDRYQ